MSLCHCFDIPKCCVLIFQRSSSCPVHVCDGRWCASGNCLKEAPPWFAAEDGSLITSVCVRNFVWLCGRPMCWWRRNIALEAGQSSFWCHSFSIVCIGSCGMFFSEQGQVQLLPKEPISTEVRGHGYNSSAKGRISYLETASTRIWSVLHCSILGHFKTYNSIFFPPHRCHGSDFTELFGQRPQRLY